MDVDSLFLVIFLSCSSFFAELMFDNIGQLSRHGRFSHPESLQAVLYMTVMSILFKFQLTINSLTFAAHPCTILTYFAVLVVLAINVDCSLRKDRRSNFLYHFALNMLKRVYPEVPREEHQQRAKKLADNQETIREFVRNMVFVMFEQELRREAEPNANAA